MKLEDLPQSVREWFENYDKPILLMINQIGERQWAIYVDDDPEVIDELAKHHWRFILRREKKKRLAKKKRTAS